MKIFSLDFADDPCKTMDCGQAECIYHEELKNVTCMCFNTWEPPTEDGLCPFNSTKESKFFESFKLGSQDTFMSPVNPDIPHPEPNNMPG